MWDSPCSKRINAPRLVARNLPFNQSKNRLQVKHNGYTKFKLYRLLINDCFHIWLGFPTLVSMLTLVFFWTFAIIIFASLYVALDNVDPLQECGLGSSGTPISFAGAFIFSLETCSTVGYGFPGTKQAFFSNCGGLQIIIYLQMLFSMVFNALLLAFFYSRIAKCDVS